jgi:hypothetical protein
MLIIDISFKEKKRNKYKIHERTFIKGVVIIRRIIL